MRITRLLLFLFILSVTLLFAQEGVSNEVYTETVSNARNEPLPTRDTLTNEGANLFMWHVASSNASVTILGSIHVGYEELYPLDERIESAFTNADTLVVEVDILNEGNKNATQVVLMAKGFYWLFGSLRDDLPEHIYIPIVRKALESGMDIRQINRMKPWLVMLSVPTSETPDFAMPSAAFGIDHHFLRKAYQTGKEIRELESPTIQLEMLSDLPIPTVVAVISNGLYTKEGRDEAMFPKMYRFWLTGDARAMEDLLLGNRSHNGLEQFYIDVFDKRNYTMTEKIEALLARGTRAFVIVGAGHLVGEEGIIALLEEKGYTVTQY